MSLLTVIIQFMTHTGKHTFLEIWILCFFLSLVTKKGPIWSVSVNSPIHIHDIWLTNVLGTSPVKIHFGVMFDDLVSKFGLLVRDQSHTKCNKFTKDEKNWKCLKCCIPVIRWRKIPLMSTSWLYDVTILCFLATCYRNIVLFWMTPGSPHQGLLSSFFLGIDWFDSWAFELDYQALW
jgi:hypothetical protein